LFRIKICGLTTVDDALFAAEQGADALGLNFYPKSPRYLSSERAAEIAAAVNSLAVGQNVRKTGVFVNESESALVAIAQAAGLDAWQLHGDEPAELIASLKAKSGEQRQVLRAFRCREPDLGAVERYLNECNTAGSLPDAVLLDAYAPDAFGGTGKVVDWHVVREQRSRLSGLPVILAGGLTPDNVAEAIRTARPDGVDVASGVESSPGVKDPMKVRDFIAAARGALEEIRLIPAREAMNERKPGLKAGPAPLPGVPRRGGKERK
jgi:phosphoribosylanthranilate isomerase